MNRTDDRRQQISARQNEGLPPPKTFYTLDDICSEVKAKLTRSAGIQIASGHRSTGAGLVTALRVNR